MPIVIDKKSSNLVIALCLSSLLGACSLVNRIFSDKTTKEIDGSSELSIDGGRITGLTPEAGRGESCRFFNQWINSGVPKAPLQQLLYFSAYSGQVFAKSTTLSLADYSKNSKDPRFYLLDLRSGNIQVKHVSHGSGRQGGAQLGDPDHDGKLDSCQNFGNRKNMTRVGFFRTDSPYKSTQKWPSFSLSGHAYVNGLRLQGLSPTNTESMSAGVVMHEANYNDRAKMGRSYGCPAFRPGEGRGVFEKIKNGSLFYSYAPQCQSLMTEVLEQVPNWSAMCTRP